MCDRSASIRGNCATNSVSSSDTMSSMSRLGLERITRAAVFFSPGIATPTQPTTQTGSPVRALAMSSRQAASFSSSEAEVFSNSVRRSSGSMGRSDRPCPIARPST